MKKQNLLTMVKRTLFVLIVLAFLLSIISAFLFDDFPLAMDFMRLLVVFMFALNIMPKN